jgi:hypothetical protein
VTTLDTLIEQQREQREQSERRLQESIALKQAEENAIKQVRITRMEKDLRAALVPAYGEFDVEYETTVDPSYTWWEVKAVITDPVSGYRFAITRRYKESPDESEWTLRWWPDEVRSYTLDTSKLLPQLINCIIDARALKARYDAEQAEEAEKDRVDAEIRALIAVKEAEARAAAWQWPTGKVATIYVMQYCTGAVLVGEENTVQADYRTVYTLTDELDERGYITVFDRGYSSFTQEDIRLSTAYHKPSWTRLTLTGLDDVPNQILTDDITLTVPGVCAKNSYRGSRFVYADTEPLFRRVASNAIPAKWLRELVDRA